MVLNLCLADLLMMAKVELSTKFLQYFHNIWTLELLLAKILRDKRPNFRWTNSNVCLQIIVLKHNEKVLVLYKHCDNFVIF